MPSLAELQRGMRASLVACDDTIASFVVADGIAPADRLQIYRNTFASVSTRALRLNYPAVAKLVGDDFFEAIARSYVAERPPASAWLDGYGAGFAGFLARCQEAATLAWLPGVARLEWSVSRVLHAPERSALDARALAELRALEADEQASVRFTRRPALRMLRTSHPADAIWRATLTGDDDALAAIDPDAGARWLLVERSVSGISVSVLSEPEWRFTRELFRGCSLQQALELADARTEQPDSCAERPDVHSERFERFDPFDPVALLAAHLAAGRFSEYRVADAPESEPEETTK